MVDRGLRGPDRLLQILRTHYAKFAFFDEIPSVSKKNRHDFGRLPKMFFGMCLADYPG